MILLIWTDTFFWRSDDMEEMHLKNFKFSIVFMIFTKMITEIIITVIYDTKN